MPTNLFIAFAKEDRNVRDNLLRQMNLVKDREGWNIWAAHEIKAGAAWNEEIKARLADSEVVVLLMSSDFFNSNYILTVELPTIIEKHRAGNCIIIPVLARHCHWKDTALGGYIALGDIQALPPSEHPIVSRGVWDSEEEPYLVTVAGIKAGVRAYKEGTKNEPLVKRLVKQKPWELRIQSFTARSLFESQKMVWWYIGSSLLVLLLIWFVAQNFCTGPHNKAPLTPPVIQDDEVAYRGAASANTIPAWRDFIKQNPKSSRVSEASQKLAQLQKTYDRDLADARIFIRQKYYPMATMLLQNLLGISPDDTTATQLLRSIPPNSK